MQYSQEAHRVPPRFLIEAQYQLVRDQEKLAEERGNELCANTSAITVDLAELCVSLASSFATGGWMPKGKGRGGVPTSS